MTKRAFGDLSPRQQTALLIAISIQVSLAVTAWVDLARRPAAQVNGSKARWAAIIAVSFVGPIGYLLRGRRPSPTGLVPDRVPDQADPDGPVV